MKVVVLEMTISHSNNNSIFPCNSCVGAENVPVENFDFHLRDSDVFKSMLDCERDSQLFMLL